MLSQINVRDEVFNTLQSVIETITQLIAQEERANPESDKLLSLRRSRSLLISGEGAFLLAMNRKS